MPNPVIKIKPTTNDFQYKSTNRNDFTINN